MRSNYSNMLTSLLFALCSGSALGASVDNEANTASATSIVLCNPLSATSCAADPALATSVVDNFQSASDNYLPYETPDEIYYGDDGLTLTLSKRFDNPSLVSSFYIMFGRIEVSLKTAYGTGIISSFFLQSDDLDEIDLEWFGGDASQMQSNFFSKGDTTTYDRGQYHEMSDPRSEFHNYTLDWTQESLNWYIDGSLVRTLANDTSDGYPQSPMRVYFGIWAGGDPSNAEGTIEWAGGETDYSDAPFSMYINNLIVSDYSTGSDYSYTDKTGDWTSIEALDGKVNGRKEIAIQEFDSLVNSNSIDDTVSISGNIISSSSITKNLSSKTTTSSNTKEGLSTTSTMKMQMQTGMSSQTSKSSSSMSMSMSMDKTTTKNQSSTAKSEHDSTTMKTSTSEHASSKSSSASASASISSSAYSNACANNVYAGSSALACILFAISLL